MRTGAKITLQFNLIVSVILIGFAFSVYYFFSDYAREEFYIRLKEEATTTARFYSEIEEVTYDLLKKIDQNSANVLPDEKVLIYNTNNKLLYSSAAIDVDEIDHRKLDNVKRSREITYRQGKYEVYGMLFEGRYEPLLIFSMAWDQYGQRKLTFLKYILIIGVLIGILITTMFGYLFSRAALRPISSVVQQVDRITASNLNLRVNEGNGKDEIAQLAIKFNKMLERLEAAFDMQKSFVSNASHELRTPLTALTGEIEVALMSQEISNDTRQVLHSLLDDIRGLNRLSNSLLELAHASVDISEIRLDTFRMDEIIGAARAEVLRGNKDYSIHVQIGSYPEDEHWLTCRVNEHLMRSALLNVMENACKYSPDHRAGVEVEFDNQNLRITVSDNGIGIPADSIAHIFEPFYRSENARGIKGHGVGLTLVHRILQLHGGQVTVKSRPGTGTNVELLIPHL